MGSEWGTEAEAQKAQDRSCNMQRDPARGLLAAKRREFLHGEAAHNKGEMATIQGPKPRSHRNLASPLNNHAGWEASTMQGVLAPCLGIKPKQVKKKQ